MTLNHMWAWNSDGSYRIQASGDKLITVEGIDESYKFVPFYITLDHEYQVQTDWEGTKQGTLELSGALENMFDGVLFYTGGSGNQTQNFMLDLEDLEVSIDEEGHYNIFCWAGYPDDEGVGTNGIFYSVEEFNQGIEHSHSEFPTNTIHDETEPGDLNIYFYGTLSGNRTDYQYIHAWNDNESWDFQQSGDDFVTVEGINNAEAQFIPWYITLGKAYTVYKEWFYNKGTKRVRFTLDNLFNRLIFRNYEGSFQVPGDNTPEIILSTDSLAAEEDGTYNIFVYEHSVEGGAWAHDVYYGIDAFNAAMGWSN